MKISAIRYSCHALVLLLLPLTLWPQQAATFSSDVRVVNVLATVRDSKGNIVKSLNKDDFTLTEEGNPETIRYFSRETDAPLTLGLLVDTSFSMAQELDNEKGASGNFATNVLRDGKDSAFLIHFDHEVELLRDVSTSRDRFVSGLQLLRTTSPEQRQQGTENPQGGDSDDRGEGRQRGGFRHGGTMLYDAVYLASNEVLAKQQGRKAIIVLSDGMDRGSKMSLDEAVEAAQRANTIVYTLYFEGQKERRESGFGRPMGGGRRGGGWPGGGGGWPGGGGGYPGGGGGRYPGGGGGGYPGGGGQRGQREPAVDGKKIMERLAQETGGRMFQVSKKESLEQIYATIQDELRNQYNLGYTPAQKDSDGEDYRHIQVTVKEKGYKVQAREGYYVTQPAATKTSAAAGSN